MSTFCDYVRILLTTNVHFPNLVLFGYRYGTDYYFAIQTYLSFYYHLIITKFEVDSEFRHGDKCDQTAHTS